MTINELDIENKNPIQHPSPSKGIAALINLDVSNPYLGKQRWFLVVALLQLSILSYLGASKAAILATGTHITVRAMPVDPRDWFRGDYVSLQYPFQDVSGLTAPDNSDQTAKAAKSSKTGIVYVVLKKGSPYWTKVSACADKPPSPGADEVILKGNVDTSLSLFGNSHAKASFGIEQFYVEEKQGLKLQTCPNLKTDLVVDSSGNAVIANVSPE